MIYSNFSENARLEGQKHAIATSFNKWRFVISPKMFRVAGWAV